jgi:O-antigen ligase
MRILYFLMGSLIAAFPIGNFHFKFFRGISCHFFHHYKRVAPFIFTMPPLFQKFICFYLTDFFIVAILIGFSFQKKVRMKELFFNTHSRYLTCFIFAAFLSIVFSIFSNYYFQYTTLLNLALAFLGFNLVYMLYKNRPDLIRPTLWAFLSVTVLECAIGIGQFLMQHHLGLQFLAEPKISPYMHNIAVFSLEKGKMFLSGLLPWIPENHSLILRAHGTFDSPNIFGGYLCISLFISYYGFITSTNRLARGLLLSFIPIQILTIALTFSRGSIFAWILATLIFFGIGLMKKTIFSPETKKHFYKLGVFIGIGIIIVFALLYDHLYDRGGFVNINSLSSSSDQGRLLFYRIAYLLFLHSPFLGIGYNGFALFPYGMLAPELEGVNIAGSLSHNIYLQTAAETGLLGLSLLLLFIFSLYKPYLKKQLTPLSFTLGIIFFSILLIGAVDHFWLTYTSGRLMFFLFAGLFAACTKAEVDQCQFDQERNATVPLPSSQ